MVELCLRLVLSASFVGMSALTGVPSFSSSWPVAIFFAAYSGVGYLFERYGIRNPGTSGFLAVADAGVISYVAASLGAIDQFGFLVLVPVTYAAARYGSNPAAMAPIAAAWVITGSNLQGGMTPLILAQALAVLVIGLLLNQGRIVMTATRALVEPTLDEVTGPDPTEYMQLRESFRALRNHCRSLEGKSRRDAWAMKLLECAEMGSDRILRVVSQTVEEISGADSVTIYLVNHLDSRLAAADLDEAPSAIELPTTFELKSGQSEAQLKHQMDLAVRAFSSDVDRQRSASVILKHRGVMIGAMVLTGSSIQSLSESVGTAEELAPVVAAVLFTNDRHNQIQRRLTEAELLYSLASTTSGAETYTGMLARTVRELWSTLKLDHLAAFVLEGTEAIQVATSGANIRLMESLRFPAADGIEGWLQESSPQIVIQDAASSSLCDRSEAVRRRVGSFVSIPIRIQGSTFGFVTAATHRSSGIDSPELDTLRLVVNELSLTIGRMQSPSTHSTGLMTPTEFNHALEMLPTGCLIYVEPLRIPELETEFGEQAVSQTIRHFALKLRSKLPPDGMLCRRDQNDFVAFLPSMDDAAGRLWAHEASVLASLTMIRSETSRTRSSLTVRARVASYSQQINLISTAS